MNYFMHRDEEVDYFPSRFDAAKNEPRYPIPSAPLAGRREKVPYFVSILLHPILSDPSQILLRTL
jgi:hypothetical protein